MVEYDLGLVVGSKGDKGDKGDTGNTGNGIASIELLSTSGKNKTYRITYTNGNHFDYVVADGADGEATIVTSWETTLSDTKVPSEKLTKNTIDNKQDTLVSGTNIKTINNTSILGSGNIAFPIVTSWETTLSDSKVPSEKLVKNSLPTKTSDLTNDGDGTNVFVKNNDSRLTDSRTPTSHTHGNLQNNGQVGSTAQANYNVVTDSNGKITTEAKPTIPSASSTTPSADVSGGAIGSGTTWAKADHQHPLSTAYATAGHTHTGMLTSSDIADNLTTNDSTKVLSAKQGKVLYDLIAGIENDMLS